jgi:hypothetical protein
MTCRTVVLPVSRRPPQGGFHGQLKPVDSTALSRLFEDMGSG